MHNREEPAFACSSNHIHQDGMTLRDYFAAQALSSCSRLAGEGSYERIAKAAYKQADAMMLVRNAN